MTMILVVGATGTNGREVVNRLDASGVRVRALVRDPDRAGELRRPNVELIRGDLDDPGSLDAALSGIERAFFVAAVSPRYVDWFRNFLDSARRAGIRHVVKFSGMGAGTDSPSEIMRQHGETDEALAASGLPFTILRPNSFHQNLLWSAGTIRDQGAFYLPLKDIRQSLVDVRDITSTAVAVLTGAGHAGRTYEVTGPESLSYHDVAAILSRVLGRPVRYVDVPPEAALESMLKAGMPEWNARAVTELYGAFAAAQYARTTDAVEQVTGRRPISFEQFARDHAAAFS
jgi:uncharacterized protein YbjT (DUF2867 family)